MLLSTVNFYITYITSSASIFLGYICRALSSNPPLPNSHAHTKATTKMKRKRMRRNAQFAPVSCNCGRHAGLQHIVRSARSLARHSQSIRDNASESELESEDEAMISSDKESTASKKSPGKAISRSGNNRANSPGFGFDEFAGRHTGSPSTSNSGEDDEEDNSDEDASGQSVIEGGMNTFLDEVAFETEEDEDIDDDKSEKEDSVNGKSSRGSDHHNSDDGEKSQEEEEADRSDASIDGESHHTGREIQDLEEGEIEWLKRASSTSYLLKSILIRLALMVSNPK